MKYALTTCTDTTRLDELGAALIKTDQAVFIERDGAPILVGIDLVQHEVDAILEILNGPLNRARGARIFGGDFSAGEADNVLVKE